MRSSIESVFIGDDKLTSIFGTRNGTITHTQTITVQKIYTYSCTGGHTEYARLWNSSLDVNATGNGYKENWHNLSFISSVKLS